MALIYTFIIQKILLVTLFMMKHFFCLNACIFIFGFGFSQNNNAKSDSFFIQDKRVTTLIQKHIAINESKKDKINGYRVQIHFGAEKAKAMEIRTKFSTEYQKIPTYFDYQQPYFKVRVGNFRTKLEAYKLLQEISGDFSGGFIVSDEIELPAL